jgi:hypothetical protein
LEVHLGTSDVNQALFKRSVKNQSGNHIPISVNLQDIRRVLISHRHDGKKISERTRQEFAANTAASGTHHRLSSKFIQLENQFCLFDGGIDVAQGFALRANRT